MSARFIMISRYETTPEALEALCEKLAATRAGRILKSVNKPAVVEIRALDDTTSLTELVALAPRVGNSDIAPLLVADVRREILDFVEAPKNCFDAIPQTRHLQLRHVEVKPAMMAAYRKWREETIFDVVRGNDAAEIFLAYHSLISGQPGVMFVAGFDGEIADYNADFTSERYRDIVKQAGDTYITGGTDGLYTEFYETVAGVPEVAAA